LGNELDFNVLKRAPGKRKGGIVACAFLKRKENPVDLEHRPGTSQVDAEGLSRVSINHVLKPVPRFPAMQELCVEDKSSCLADWSRSREECRINLVLPH